MTSLKQFVSKLSALQITLQSIKLSPCFSPPFYHVFSLFGFTSVAIQRKHKHLHLVFSVPFPVSYFCMPALARSFLVFFSFAYSDCCMMVFIHFESSFKISFCIAMESLLLSLIKSHRVPTLWGMSCSLSRFL